MIDAGFELIKAMIAALKADATVSGYVGTRIYDRVPEGAAVVYPYISVGSTTALDDGWDCTDAEAITVQLDVWSSGPGEAWSGAECRKISGAVRRALHDAELTLSTNALVSIRHELTRILDDPNPAIRHGAVQFTAETELH